jgi:hypothetical protein
MFSIRALSGRSWRSISPYSLTPSSQPRSRPIKGGRGLEPVPAGSGSRANCTATGRPTQSSRAAPAVMSPPTLRSCSGALTLASSRLSVEPNSLIHPSAWKRNSANFACREFTEVRIAPVQHPWASLAEIGFLRVLSDLLRLPHNTHRTYHTLRRLLAERAGAERLGAPCVRIEVGGGFRKEDVPIERTTAPLS